MAITVGDYSGRVGKWARKIFTHGFLYLHLFTYSLTHLHTNTLPLFHSSTY